jgi:hypothetical protein
MNEKYLSAPVARSVLLCAPSMVEIDTAICARNAGTSFSPHFAYHTWIGLYTGRTDGNFQLFETLTWHSELGSHAVSGLLIDALWSGATSLPSLILVCSKQLVAVHFTEPAPSLHVQFMALAAPQVWEGERSNGALSSSLAASKGVRLSL